PPEEATEAEIDPQIDQLLSYQTTFEDDDTDRACEEGDVVSCDIADKEGAAHLAGKNRTLSLNPAGSGVPEELVQGIVGMKAGETKEISWTHSHTHEDEVHEHTFTVEVTLNSIKKAVTPELTDELAKNSFGFDTIDELRDAVKEEIEEDKTRSLPRLKEDRVVEALGERLQLEEVPEPFLNQVMNELANEFLQQLQRQGMSLDMYLGARGMKTEDFMNDLRQQAMDRARQSVALDALAKKLEFVATTDDVRAEVEKAGVEDVDSMIEQLSTEGRLPAIREAIRRSKAVDWLVENATVTVVDEIAERRDDAESDEAAPEAEAAEPEEADAE
ncbi:MAG: trigger factor, partial [Atopobiaceae bacterium]|nr:trigger factor [Atopobiaceae bacterium]